jgi:hypothetical protein
MQPGPERDAEDEATFNPDTRCCTYHPTLANFLVGRILRRTDAGSFRMRQRLQPPNDGLAWIGVEGVRWRERLNARGRFDFGNDVDLLCPFYAAGEFGCTIWRDRGAVCRTWHCKHTDGPRAHELWVGLKKLIGYLDLHLAKWCVNQGTPRKLPRTSREWARWYIRCADRLDGVTSSELRVALPDLEAYWDAIVRRDGQRVPMPEVLIPSVGRFDREGEVIRLLGYSMYDPIDVPRNVFVFLSKLDGTTPWQDAMTAARAEGLTWLDEARVAEMWRVGVVGGTWLLPDDHPGPGSYYRVQPSLDPW